MNNISLNALMISEIYDNELCKSNVGGENMSYSYFGTTKMEVSDMLLGW